MPHNFLLLRLRCYRRATFRDVNDEDQKERQHKTQPVASLSLLSKKKKGKENPVDSTQKTAKGQLWHLEANRKRGGLAVHQHESIMASHHFSSSLFFSFFPREETGGEVCAKLWQRSWKSRQEGPGMCDQSKFHISGRSEAQRRKRTNTQQGSRNRNKNEKRKQEKKVRAILYRSFSPSSSGLEKNRNERSIVYYGSATTTSIVVGTQMATAVVVIKKKERKNSQRAREGKVNHQTQTHRGSITSHIAADTARNGQDTSSFGRLYTFSPTRCAHTHERRAIKKTHETLDRSPVDYFFYSVAPL